MKKSPLIKGNRLQVTGYRDYGLSFTCYLLPVTCYLLFAACYLLFLLALSTLLTFPALATGEKSTSLTSSIDALLKNPSLKGSRWGIEIARVKNKEVLYRKNELSSFIPASNAKLFTTAAALCELGPEYCYHTSLYVRGRLMGSSLEGDLILYGRGDPTFSENFYDRATEPLEALAHALLRKGIKRITGDLIGNHGYFSPPSIGPQWPKEDRLLWFSAPTSALCFNDNSFAVMVRPVQKDGGMISVSLLPATGAIQVHNSAKTIRRASKTSLSFSWNEKPNTLEVKGGLGLQSSGVSQRLAVEDPALFTASAFLNTLKRKGIKVEGTVRTSTEDIDSDLLLIGEAQSPPLSKLIRFINKESHNLSADQLFKTLGKETSGDGSFQGGARAVEAFLNKAGIGTDNSFTIVDGSGLSRLNRVTPHTILQLLLYMDAHPYSDSFSSSLPIAGVDRTLRKRMLGTRADRNVRAKTGYLKKTIALSGYVRARGGELLAFSILVNDLKAPPGVAKRVEDKICILLAEWEA